MFGLFKKAQVNVQAMSAATYAYRVILRVGMNGTRIDPEFPRLNELLRKARLSGVPPEKTAELIINLLSTLGYSENNKEPAEGGVSHMIDNWESLTAGKI